MFGRKTNPDAPSAREMTSRRLQQIGLTVAGETGARIANKVSEAIGCGRIEPLCDDPSCFYCERRPIDD